jgi:hypothetical protein
MPTADRLLSAAFLEFYSFVIPETCGAESSRIFLAPLLKAGPGQLAALLPG